MFLLVLLAAATPLDAKAQDVLASASVLSKKASADASFQSAEKLAAALFAPYKNDGEYLIPDIISEEALPNAPKGYLHGRLAEAVASFLERTKDNPEVSLGFDALIDGQDFELTDFKIHPAEISDTSNGKQAGRVIVTFKNFGEPREIWLGVEQVKGEHPWRLTSVHCERGHEGRKYDLAELLDELDVDSSSDETPSASAE